MSKAWKQAEKEVAEKLGGTRRIRINYSESVEDITHPVFTIEVKYGAQVPRYCHVLSPTSNGEYVLVPSASWGRRIQPEAFNQVRIGRDKFIVNGLAQAYGYNPRMIPMLCVKPKRWYGFVIIMRESDYENL